MRTAVLFVAFLVLLTGTVLSTEFLQEYLFARRRLYRFGTDERRSKLRYIRRTWLRTTLPFWLVAAVLFAMAAVWR